MWIAEFAQAAGLSVATVRYYVREKLLAPSTGLAGGSRPYLDFSDKDLRLVAAIRAGQALGMSLAEIRTLVDERRSGAGSRTKILAAMREHREKLRQRAVDLEAMARFVDAKIKWLSNGAQGEPPEPPPVQSPLVQGR